MRIELKYKSGDLVMCKQTKEVFTVLSSRLSGHQYDRSYVYDVFTPKGGVESLEQWQLCDLNREALSTPTGSFGSRI